ncbi:Crp/Fnr family transcriptional regulator [Parvularcula sp. IMCC14364]|uniref:Crp/Fnr family transcriptional regulator n=1 Tax=Parvularcula sp. IMCC14364 TaxID=3067902 RepID=UPI00274134A7|nr:Crp/Fnr family transcriptional regulator [Parvularcula sp. IMCC14364]
MISAATVTQDSAGQCDHVRDALLAFDSFNILPESSLAILADHTCKRAFGAGETVFAMSQYDGGEIFCIVSGQASLTTMSPSTGALSVEQMSAGQVFGLEYVLGEFDQQDLQVGLTAMSELEILKVDGEQVLDLVKRKPVVARAFLVNFARQLLNDRRGAEEHHDDPCKRIYRALFDMLERDERQFTPLWHISAMPKHRELAEVAGTSEAEVAEIVAKLISQNIAQRNYPGLIITDYSRFHSLAL